MILKRENILLQQLIKPPIVIILDLQYQKMNNIWRMEDKISY